MCPLGVTPDGEKTTGIDKGQKVWRKVPGGAVGARSDEGQIGGWRVHFWHVSELVRKKKLMKIRS